VIFRQQDSDAFHKYYFPLPFVTGSCAQMVVPLPGVDSTRKLPPTMQEENDGLTGFS
jgi:hypothetical protein